MPSHAAEPGAAGNGCGVDKAEGCKGGALRDKHVGEISTPAQSEPATACCDHQSQGIGEERPKQSPCALRAK